MDNLEQMLEGVLSNPEAMQKIMGLAQSLGVGPQEEKPAQPQSPLPDLGNLSQLTELMSHAGIDSRQQALLSALNPYLHGNRIQKLQRAMQAARMAEMASSLMGKARSESR